MIPSRTAAKDDEDEGSLPQGRANPGEIMPEENRMISGCPPGTPQSPQTFPPNIIPHTMLSGQPGRQKTGSGRSVIWYL